MKEEKDEALYCLPEGTLLQGGKYRIMRLIGSGGFGCTYEALQRGLEERVAIKEFYLKDYCNRKGTTALVTVGSESMRRQVEKMRRKFLDEAKALSKMRHKGIVRVRDFFEENGTAYLVMDYIGGGSLADMVKHGPLGESQALRYIRQVCDALKEVHSHKRLHLDLKPGNIMIDGEDNAILIDFGASKQYDEEKGGNTSTVRGYTRGYAPEEQIGGNIQNFRPATDIYALGATLYTLLTGTTPPPSNELGSGTAVLKPLPADISDSTRRAVEAAMQRKIGDRPQSTDDFLKILDDTTVMDPTPNDDTVMDKSDDKPQTGPQEQPAPKPHKQWRITVAVAAIVVCLFGAFLLWNYVINAPKTGVLRVDYKPTGIDIYVDGEWKGRNPCTIGGLAAGEHVVALNAGTSGILMYYDDTLTITIIENDTVFMKGKLESWTLNFDDLKDLYSKEDDDKTTIGKINGHEYADLGLSVVWATTNVGAYLSTSIGDYYAWGETEKKYKFIRENSQTYKKSVEDISGTEYDVARFLWGSPWRMPTREEMEELLNNCTWTWTKEGYKNGYKVTGKNGKSIFLPTTGWKESRTTYYPRDYGRYWTSTPDNGGTQGAWTLYFSQDKQGTGWYNYFRYYGQAVRPVADL